VILLHEASAQLFRTLPIRACAPRGKDIFDYLHRLAPVRADVRLIAGHQQMNDRLGGSPAARSSDS
jgi:hypothetical protein